MSEKTLAMSHRAKITTGALAAAALLTGLLAIVQLVGQANLGPRAVALACFFGTGTVSLLAGMVITRVPRVQALLAVAGAGASAAMVLAGFTSFGSLFLPPFLLWLASALLLCRAAHPRRIAVAVAAVGGLGVVLLALPVIVAAFPPAR